MSNYRQFSDFVIQTNYKLKRESRERQAQMAWGENNRRVLNKIMTEIQTLCTVPVKNWNEHMEARFEYLKDVYCSCNAAKRTAVYSEETPKSYYTKVITDKVLAYDNETVGGKVINHLNQLV
jgi:hypothetical protein